MFPHVKSSLCGSSDKWCEMRERSSNCPERSEEKKKLKEVALDLDGGDLNDFPRVSKS